MCTAGLGEWGTSGSAWFLAMKWKELLKRSKGRDFGAVIRVRQGQDESAEIIDFVVRKKSARWWSIWWSIIFRPGK